LQKIAPAFRSTVYPQVLFLHLRMIKVNYSGCFGDSRLDHRGLELQEGLFRNSVHSIQQIAETRAEQKAYYRFLKNDKVSEGKLIEELSNRCGKLAKGKVVLSIQDTTEINLFNHRNRIDKESGIGDIGDSILGIGFMLHPSLVVDAETCFPLGFSDVRIWNREVDMANKNDRNYKKLNIEEKESYKWIESSNKTKEALSEAKAVIIIQDREGDIFEQFARIPDQKTFLLIRSRTDRKLESNEKLWNRLSGSTILGQYELDVAADLRRKTPARKATIEVRAVEVRIKPPVHYKNKDADLVLLYAVEAREINDSVEQPVHWRLVTTWPVNSFDDCICVIEWYTWRWQIEEVFKTLKKERYDIEGSELECGWAIRKLAIIMMDVIVKLMQMRIAYSYPEGECPSTNTVFSKAEQQCLKEVTKKMEGKTTKLQNPYPPNHLKWAVWTIARLGGWKGYKSQRPPGLTTLQEGLDKFYSIFNGWILQKDVGTR
jgi:hypothetical protein